MEHIEPSYGIGDDQIDQYGLDKTNGLSEEEQLSLRVQQALEETTSMNLTSTYESLCRRHIENFMKGAENYARETGLSERVSHWTKKIEPILNV